jgi:hypothetical protein
MLHVMNSFELSVSGFPRTTLPMASVSLWPSMIGWVSEAPAAVVPRCCWVSAAGHTRSACTRLSTDMHVICMFVFIASLTINS